MRSHLLAAGLRRLLLPLFLVGLLAAATVPGAAAAGDPAAAAAAAHREVGAKVIQLHGASPSYAFTPPHYTYTNQGTGTIDFRQPVTWKYVEQGMQTGPSSSVLLSAVYTINPANGPSITLHAIPSTYVIHYDNPTIAPCGPGEFFYAFQEGGFALGRFTSIGNPPACEPTAVLDVTIVTGGQFGRKL
jgi:hypothetical protein